MPSSIASIEQLLDEPGVVGDGLRAGVAGLQAEVLLLEGQQARRLAADDRHAALGVRGEPLGHALRHRACPVEQALGDARAPAAARRLEPHGVAGRLEQLDRGAPDRRLREGGERVGEEDDLAPAELGALLVPADQRVALEARQRPAAVDPGGALEQPPRGEVGERRGGRADPVERADRAEQPRPQRHPVRVLVVAEELGLQRRHVDAQRALALARLALEAEVEDLVQPLVAERLLPGPVPRAP